MVSRNDPDLLRPGLWLPSRLGALSLVLATALGGAVLASPDSLLDDDGDQVAEASEDQEDDVLRFAPPPPLEDDDDDDDGDDDDDDDDEKEEEEVDATVKEAVKGTLTHKHTLKPGNIISITYPLTEGGEQEDFDSKGFDKFEIGMVDGWARSGTGMEIGAGSRRMGVMRHRLPLTGDFEIEVELWVNTNTPSAKLCFLLSKKVGVAWGQTIVKPKRLKPWNKKARWDGTLFKEEKMVKCKMTKKGPKLTVKCNGRKTDEKTFKKGELDKIQFGVMAQNIRFIIETITIEAQVDVSKL